MRQEQPWRRIPRPLTPVHSWQRVDARRTQCRVCGLKAHSEWDGPRRKAYTLWVWRNLLWDSRESAIPTCPPSYHSERGINPRMVVKPGEGLGGVDR